MTVETQIELIARLGARAHDPALATDEGPGALGTPAAPAQMAAAEAALGFPLPALLRRVYQEVGDGGFGPGQGLLNLASAAERYLALRKSQKGPPWPVGLLPLCEWGSGIVSLLDCARPEALVVRVDPNMQKADVGARVPAALHFDKAKQVADACWVESPSLEAWLTAWADGKRLFYLAYGGADADEDDFEDAEDDEGEDEE